MTSVGFDPPIPPHQEKIPRVHPANACRDCLRIERIKQPHKSSLKIRMQEDVRLIEDHQVLVA